MYCSNCGKEVQPQAVVCVHCGVRLPAPKPKDGSIGALGIVCFAFPVVGLILYINWKDTMPVKANGAGKAAPIGFIIDLGFYVFYIIGTVLMVLDAF